MFQLIFNLKLKFMSLELKTPKFVLQNKNEASENAKEVTNAINS